MPLYGEPLTRLVDFPGPAMIEGRFILLGHFDDPAARECRGDAPEGAEPPDPDQVVLRCRTAFVVTEATRIR